jgi:hypothetical protein
MLPMFLYTNIAFANQYQFLGKWYLKPTISICQGSHVKIEDVEKAVHYWQDRGFSLGNIVQKDNCTQKYPYGFIQFNDPKDDVDTDRSFGHSQIEQEGKRIHSVSIQISDEGAKYYEVVVHELGHALGIKHIEDRTDIMYIYHVSAYTKM